jgi:predicted dehydrogenase
MVEAAKRHGVRLMVGHKRRLRPAWQRLLELTRQGALGQLTAVNINGWHHHPDIPAWWLRAEYGGGLLHRAGVHDVDYLTALLGEPEWVQAVAPPPVRSQLEFPETLSLHIGYRQGAIGGLQVSLWFVPTHFCESFHVQAIGTGGSALLTRSLDNQQTLAWGADAGQLHRESFEGDGREACALELRSFVDWVLDHRPPVLTWREGWRCVQVMEAAYASAAAEGRRVAVEALPP